MRQGCYNKNLRRYIYYGAKGITVCSRWINSFVNFLEDMGEKPNGYCLLRIDKKLPYSKNNCKWATHQEICDNRDMPIVKYKLGGNEFTNKQIAEKYNLNKRTSWARLRMLGWDKESFERGKNIKGLNNKTKSLRKLFENYKEVLTLKEIEFVSLRIGIDSTPRTLQEVADIKRLTKQRVAQIIDMAVFKMMKSVNNFNKTKL
jgi:predicted DNA-binding protein YlxM (UPF0122 family)